MAGSSAGTLDDKWVAEGKGKGRMAEYLDREPALKAERVMARSRGGLLRQANKGGTADFRNLSFIQGQIFLFLGPARKR